MVLFCAVVAPVLLVVSISYLWLGNVLGMNLRPVLLMLGKLKEWVMLDIYLVGIGVASIKVQDYAFLQPGIGLVAFISLTLLSILTLIHMNVEELWERFYPGVRRPAPIIICRCAPAAITPAIATRGRCRRCHTPLHHRRPQSLQRSWAALIASLVFLFPANLLPISIIYVNGARQDDTILSGIISLASSNIAIAGVVFIASILVPFTKVIVLFTLLLSIPIQVRAGIAHPHPAAAANHLDWPLVDAGSVCYLTHHVANKSRSAPRLHHGAGCGLLWRRGNFNYSCS